MASRTVLSARQTHIEKMTRCADSFRAALLILSSVGVATSATTVHSDDQPAAQPASVPAVEPAALKLARHDLVRWTEQAKVLADVAAQANVAFEAANKAFRRHGRQRAAKPLANQRVHNEW